MWLLRNAKKAAKIPTLTSPRGDKNSRTDIDYNRSLSHIVFLNEASYWQSTNKSNENHCFNLKNTAPCSILPWISCLLLHY